MNKHFELNIYNGCHGIVCFWLAQHQARRQYFGGGGARFWVTAP